MAEQRIHKTCPKCNEIKAFSEFNKDNDRKDGLRFCCRVCDCNRKRQYRQSKKGKAIEKLYQQSKNGIAAQRRYDQSKGGKARGLKCHKKYKATHPERIKAKSAVAHAVRAGKLPRVNTLLCHYCPAQAKHRHHHKGYAPEHWLDVIPVCKKCHNKQPNSH